MSKPRYNHAYTIAFALENESEDGEGTTPEELVVALLKRVADIIANGEIEEACGAPFDTYDV